jgi:casein kinase 1
MADRTAEEFNKYLSYVRNLGFEDTPDYDFLRDLFTQALKNTGEVEDGEYDWMKLNGGRGWEVKSHTSAHHLHQPNANPDASARAMHNVSGIRGSDGRTPRLDGRGAISADRLNAAQPPPPGPPAKPGVAAMGKSARDRGSGVGGGQANLPKRSSGLAAGQLDVVTPTASTQAQFQTSAANLGNQTRPSPATGALQSNQGMSTGQQQEPQPTFFQKLMKALCCGTSQYDDK